MQNTIELMDFYPKGATFDTLTRSDRPKLIIMVGGPASGKSVVRQNCAENCNVDNAIILNPDSIMEKKFNSVLSEREAVNEEFKSLYTYIFKHKSGINIIYDRTGAYPNHTEFIVDLVHSAAAEAASIQYETILCIAIVPVDIGLQRAITREQEIGRSVPPNIILRIYETIDNVIEEYETNASIRVFRTLTMAKKQLSGSPSRVITVEDNGILVIPTKNKGDIYIEPGNYKIELSDRKRHTTTFFTPSSSTKITGKMIETDNKSSSSDYELNTDSIIHIHTDHKDRISFRNSRRLFDKILAFDNTVDGQDPELIYYYNDGHVVMDKELNKLAAAYRDNSSTISNRFAVLGTRQARHDALRRGGKPKKRKTRKKNKRKRQKKTRRYKQKTK